ncbi:MAG: hypothetical protein HIU82_04490 [Proteobacteria bacterium]|nr:hypothetical protein [Pseudomonadota bacterium]
MTETLTQWIWRTGLRGAAVAGLLLMGPMLPGRAAENATPHRGPLSSGQYQPTPHEVWCGDHQLGRLSMRQRHEGGNLARLRAADAELAPGFAAGTARTGLDLLAAYQEELEKRRPDVALAASYLAVASAVPITAARYRQVNALLCVSTTRTIAHAIATAAEAQRQQMAR